MNKEKPKVSIITRTKNRLILLRRAIDSVLGQSFKDWEHVVVNDGGNFTELSFVLEEYKQAYKGRLRVVHEEESIGMQNASNAGIGQSSGEYVVIHDDDDSWHPEFLRKCVAFLDEAGPSSLYQGVISQTERICEEIVSFGKIIEAHRDSYLPCENISLYRTAFENPFAPIAFLFRKKAYEEVGSFDQVFNVVGDWDFNLRFLKRFEIGVLDEKLAYYHWRHGEDGTGFPNTVTGGIKEHEAKANLLKNLYLRKDLNGSPGHFGFMLNISRMQFETAELSGHSLRRIQKLEGRIEAMERNGRWLSGWGRRRHQADSSAVEPCPFQPNHPRIPTPIDFTRFKKLLHQSKVVSFDVFDTCLLRTVRHPTDVFWILEDRVRELTGRGGYPFAMARASAESVARNRLRDSSGEQDEGSEEATMGEIYEVFCELTDLSPTLIEKLIALELAVEDEVIYGNPLIFSFLEKCRKEGKEIIFTSDMYMSSEMIAGLLRKNGFPDYRIFVSSETRTAKGSGRMYDTLLKELGCAPWEVMHIGDNLHSDVTMAHEKGFSPFHFNRHYFSLPYALQAKREAAFYERDLSSSLCSGWANRNRLGAFRVDFEKETMERAPEKSKPEQSFWYDLGYEIAGPAHFCFCNWLVKRARRNNLRRMYFLARDGYFLNQYFQLICKQWDLELESAYLFSSRRLLNFSKIEELNDAALEFLCTPNPNLSAGDFLARINFDPEAFLSLYKKNGLPDLNAILTTPNGVFKSLEFHRAVRSLFRSLEEEILEKAREERKILMAYLESVGLREKRIGIVDIGWQASSILSLHELLENSGSNGMMGFFFGTWRFARKAIEAGCEIESFFHHLEEPKRRRNLLNESISLIEILFTAPHPTITGVRKEAGEWKAVYGESDYEEADLEKLKILWRGCGEFIRDRVASTRGPLRSDGFTYLELALNRILREPLLEEARQLGDFKHREGFGGTTPFKRLAKPPSRWSTFFNKGKLFAAYEDSPWKKGFLTLLDEDRRKDILAFPENR